MKRNRTMGIAVMEELVSTVGAILKTLECPICLELLKTPVSAGCGHFFCQHCVSGILQSNYRAPCPLCKRSFTRRSVQAASQRQNVISAARTLAQTCSSLTGYNFTTLDSFVKESSLLVDAKTPVPSKKFRASNEKAESAPSRKRKSGETEDVEKAKQKSVSFAETKTCLEPLQGAESSKKRACPAVEDDEDSGDDLPSLEEIFSQQNPPSNSLDVSVINETAVEKPLSIFPSDRISALKTYSSLHRKKENSTTSVQSKLEEKNCSYDDYFISSKNNVTDEIGSSPKGSHGIVQMKNKINALKNKTNEVHGEKLIQRDEPASKPTNGNQKMEPMDKSKENEVLSSPSIPPSDPSPAKLKQSCTKRLRKSKNRKCQTRLQNSASAKNVSSNNANLKNSYTLNEVTLPSLECENQNEPKKSIEDPFKSMGLTDTAISVGSVGSPLAGKTLSMIKSPGWSRVKEVKKDFKVKKFTSLHVEKNSPTISHKTAVVSDQEPNPVKDKSELPMGIGEENKMDSACENVAVLESHMDQESGQGLKFNEGENNNEELVFQNENVPEPINLVDIDKLDSHMEVEKQMDATSRCNKNDTKNVNPNSLKNKEFNAGITKLPSVSITSNSVICANYTDSHDKISKHNVVKTKKIICEVPNNPLFNNDGILFSKYLQDDCPDASDALLSNPAEIKQGVYPVSSQISGYKSFQAHSVLNENDGFQYVEQSQQTSQMFNFDLQNSVLNKFSSIVKPRVFPHNASKEKTKVVKRTCLTLEEIQDCFLKSSQSNCSETLCSVPFLDGLFKLHIGVSDDTLNVSVLKVIEPSSDINNAQSELLNKYIQTSNTLLPLPAILPSSNAGSESSQPESAVEPFPYLNKVSGSEVSTQDLPPTVPSGQPHGTNYANLGSFPVDKLNCEEEINENNMDMSEIIHFPPEPTEVNQELVQNCPEPVQIVQQAEVCEIEKSPLKGDIELIIEQSPRKTNYASMECDLPRNDCKGLPSKEINTIDLDSEEFSDSDQEESLKKLEKCVYQTPKRKGKKISRLSLKKKSFKATQVLESSDESDLENSIFVKKSVAEVDSKVSSKSDKPIKPASPAENMRSSGILGKEENLKNSVHHSVAGETPTSNSLLSEDVPETNASEIILEIEDLADKIKSLEDRLKQCGHTDLQKSVSLPQVELPKPDLVHEASDSEDSFDLFPQSVPPTPPNRV